ncbi:MAG: sodium:alanine symporter family protein [Clostridia bacterium]|nr:sodium:alanine symporter family protein [Clostridia bacterium]
MNGLLEKITQCNDVVNGFIWGAFGLVLLIGTGVLMTVLTRFFQVSHLAHWWNQTIGKLFAKDTHSDGKRAISPFQAVCTALAATVGTGNIAGVAAAICIGGPGAVFWMWVAAFFGMMTNYSENVLGIYFRRRNMRGEWSGGAMYYLADGVGKKKGLKHAGKALAVLFSVFAILASFGIGSMGQVNKIVLNLQNAFPVAKLESIQVFEGVSLYPVLLGVIIMILASLIILGGLKRIASFAERVVPFMIVAFIIGSIIIIALHFRNIIPAFREIFVTAFRPKAAAGGTIGYLIGTVITQGFKRGVFSNEAGLGSSVMVHSNTTVREPVVQGMWGIFEVFADTMIVCTMTALVVLTSGVYDLGAGAIAEGRSDATLVADAFNSVFSFGNIGGKFVAVAMFLFAFTTVLGWSHYGAKAWEYLFGTKSTTLFKILHIITIFFGAVLTSSLAWDISDTFNGLMMIPNLIGVVILAPTVVKITNNYVNRILKKKDIEPLLSEFPEYQNPEEEN